MFRLEVQNADGTWAILNTRSVGDEDKICAELHRLLMRWRATVLDFANANMRITQYNPKKKQWKPV